MTKIRLSAFVCEQVSTTQKCCVLYVLIIQTYVALAAKNIGGNIQIVNYRKMADVKSTDIERITTKYDCDCTVSISFN